jgi:hypothetical protein
MLHAYVAQLKKYAEENRAKRQAERDEKARAEADAARVKLAPLEARLARLLATIPREVQEEGLSLTALQTQLRARGRGHSRCHIGELGEACRRNGLVRRRRWQSDAGGFRALWYPK